LTPSLLTHWASGNSDPGSNKGGGTFVHSLFCKAIFSQAWGVSVQRRTLYHRATSAMKKCRYIHPLRHQNSVKSQKKQNLPCKTILALSKSRHQHPIDRRCMDTDMQTTFFTEIIAIFATNAIIAIIALFHYFFSFSFSFQLGLGLGFFSGNILEITAIYSNIFFWGRKDCNN